MEPEDPSIISPFFCSREKIRIKRGDTFPLTIQFMPFVLENYQCKISFCDVNVGEFQHEILAETLLPEPLTEIKPPFQIHVDTTSSFEIPISFRNEQITNGRKIHENRLIAAGKIKEREAYLKTRQIAPVLESVTYDITMTPNSNFMNMPSLFVIYDPYKYAKKFTQENISARKDTKKKTNLDLSIDSKKTDSSFGGGQHDVAGQQNINKIPLSFHFKNPVRDYTCYIIFKNVHKTDVRLYKLMFSVAPKPIKATLEFKTPIGDILKQEIPLVNFYFI